MTLIKQGGTVSYFLFGLDYRNYCNDNMYICDSALRMGAVKKQP